MRYDIGVLPQYIIPYPQYWADDGEAERERKKEGEKEKVWHPLLLLSIPH